MESPWNDSIKNDLASVRNQGPVSRYNKGLFEMKSIEKIFNHLKFDNLRLRNSRNIISLLAIVSFTLLGCEKDQIIPEDSDYYYVKYQLSSSTIYSGGKLNVRYNAESNSFTNTTINQRQNWEVIVGPVFKGFKSQMHISASGQTHNKLKLYTNIYVSKNNGPFAIKESNGSDTPRDEASIAYTIDF